MTGRIVLVGMACLGLVASADLILNITNTFCLARFFPE
ncbi:hypothetical protein EV286_10830 [Rhizobium sp. BK251]|nr:hypothetical protein EV286_10830 [Rhizobium sp. BK251]